MVRYACTDVKEGTPPAPALASTQGLGRGTRWRQGLGSPVKAHLATSQNPHCPEPEGFWLPGSLVTSHLADSGPSGILLP